MTWSSFGQLGFPIEQKLPFPKGQKSGSGILPSDAFTGNSWIDNEGDGIGNSLINNEGATWGWTRMPP
jgi:hypothetical protein